MLNKPTNVSPYNVFVDASEGLDLNFTLNNTVDTLSVDIYKDDNTIVSGDIINNVSLAREFSYTVPEDVMTDISNGNNYYWKTRYWKTPLEENKKGEYIVNYLNKSSGCVGVLPNPIDNFKIVGINAYEEYANTTFYFGVSTEAQADSFFENYNKEENYYLGFSNVTYNGKFYPIICIGIKSMGWHPGTYFANEIQADFILRGMSSENSEIYTIKQFLAFCEKNNIMPSLYNISEDGVVLVNEYFKLLGSNMEYIYKANSSKFKLIDNKNIECLPLPTIEIFTASVLPSTIPDWSEYSVSTETIYVSGFSKAEYNESPPYYFSCRETPDISLYDVSTASPQIKIYANLAKYIEINSYSYQLYKLSGNNDWQLIWESSKTSSLNVLNNGTYNTEVEIYNGITPQSTYKIKLIGQTMEGQDIEVEKMFSSSDFAPTETKEFVSFNRELGCIEIDNSEFISPYSTYQLQIYRYDVIKDELNYVGGSTYDFNTTTEADGYCKRTTLYDFNIVSDAEYVYYAYLLDDDIIMRKYISNSITPSWSGVYLTDVSYEDSITYNPDLSKTWFIALNHEPAEITRNYQVSHPLGINQKYPKSVRGVSNFKTGSISGLLGNISCTTGDYEEGLFLIDEFDAFCANGNLKLLRSDTKGECMIVDIDNMSSSVFGQVATNINVGYTQIDDIIRKQISIEV